MCRLPLMTLQLSPDSVLLHDPELHYKRNITNSLLKETKK